MSIRLFQIVMFFLISHALSFGQEAQTVLNAPSSWRKEVIPFPLPFAPDIDFKGVEDIRFAPGWHDPSSEDFWTYYFVWYIDKSEKIADANLKAILENYYNGLMNFVLKQESKDNELSEANKTTCLVLSSENGFEYKVEVFDAFFSKKKIALNMKIEEQMCEASNKQVITFKISPKAFDDKVWELFKQIEFIGDCSK